MGARDKGLRARGIIDAVEAAYSIRGNAHEWLQRLLDATHADVDHGGGLYILTSSEATGRLTPTSPLVTRDLDPGYLGFLAAMNDAAVGEAEDVLRNRVVLCGGIEAMLGPEHPVVRHYRTHAAAFGFCDTFSLVARDGEHESLVLTAPSRSPVRPHPRVLALWKRAAFHFAAALRLRGRIASGGTAEALLAPDGRVVHAEGEARASAAARETLEHAVRAIEAVRTSKGRADPVSALEVWQGLVAGRWSLVDQWESDGRRFVAAHENRPELLDPRALSSFERAVVRYVGLGASDKEIAFALGVPLGSVASAVRAAARKLGCEGRASLVAFGTGAHARVRVGDATLDVIATGIDAAHPDLERLTATERDVAARVVAGESNAAIAQGRRTSVKTVANQIASIFQKLGVRSRGELVSRLVRSR